MSATAGSTPGMISDSLQYYAAATALAQHGTLDVPIAFSHHEQFDAAGHIVRIHPFVLWPPGYPLVLAAVMRLLSVPANSAAAMVNIGALAIVLLSLAWLIDRASGERTALAATALFGVLPPVQAVFRMALSEPLFLALCGVALVALACWLEEPTRRPIAPWVAAVSIAVAIHVRYVGVFLVPVHIGCLAWSLRHRVAPWRRLSDLLSVLSAPVLGSAFLFHRLATLGCSICANRPASTGTLASNLADFVVALAKSLPAAYELLPGPLDVVLSLAALVLLFLLHPRQESSAQSAGRRESLRVAGAFALVYATGILTLRTFVEFNSVDPRLVAPTAFVALAVGLTFGLNRLVPPARLRMAAIGTLLFAAAGVTANRAVAWRGLSDPTVRDSALVRAARSHFVRRPDVPLFSDLATIIQAHLGFDVPVYFLPTEGVPRLDPGATGVAVARRLKSEAAEKRIRQLDAAAQRIEETPDVILWDLSSSPRR